ncbi:thiosulfate sulfurtransferase/rhodanese-like domain-containing protein 3 [Huso huso]|uniref:Thiosulfate sulfurtransferase/rhodanese-like domain-containing protein 3 n=1 Tax=Huso huso TaxID=61971 RepID=A0ABR0YT33_HUSHU
MGKQLPPREHHLIPKATNLFASSQLVPGFPVRHFSSTGTSVSLAEFLQLLKEKCVCVIDVREHAELKKDGEIPGCVSVPIGDLPKALVMDPYLFEHRYKARMPRKQVQIVFTCLAGIRGKTAMETARSLGYRYVSIYKGGWKEWALAAEKTNR